MKVALLSFTPEPDKLCAACALGCHSKDAASYIYKTLTDKRIRSVLRNTVSRGHWSVIEHACFTFGVEGVSRSLTHQLVRHRIASFSQQSQRYVPQSDPDYVTPPTIARDPTIKAVFENQVNEAWTTYAALRRRGVPAEDARFVLPNATRSSIAITMNARELRHFFELRCCIVAQWEIREMAEMMLVEVQRVAPAIFERAGPSCASGSCPERMDDCPLRSTYAIKQDLCR